MSQILFGVELAMLDKLPEDISQAVITQWLSLAAIVRLDIACSGTVRWSETFNGFHGCTILAPFVTRSRCAIAVSDWVSRRQMKFSRYVLQATGWNMVQRIAIIPIVQDSVVSLTIQQTQTTVRVTETVINIPAGRPTIMSWLASFFRRGPGNSVVLRRIDHTPPPEEHNESFPTLTFPELKVLLFKGNCFNHLQWLPIVAPSLLQLHADWVAMNCATFQAIATRFPKLQHLSISLTHQLAESTVERYAAQICGGLQSLNVVDHFIIARSSGYARHLLPHCGHLQYLALYGFSINDEVCESIAMHCKQLLGLDLGEGHTITANGLQSLAVGCSSLQSVGMSISRTFPQIMKAVWNDLIVANSSTLQRIALVVGGKAADRTSSFDMLQPSARCAHLRSLHLSCATADSAPGILHLLQNCKHMESLYLPWLMSVEPAAWQMELVAQIAAQYPHVAVHCTPQRELPIWARDAGVYENANTVPSL